MFSRPQSILRKTHAHRAFIFSTVVHQALIMVTTRQATRAVSTVIPSGSSREPKRQKTEHGNTSTQGSVTSPIEGEHVKKTPETKPKKKAKSLQIDSSQFLPRVESQWKVGAHVSAAGGVENAVVNAASIGANAFALFLKSQRKWESPPLDADSIASFKSRMKEYGYQNRMVLPHGSYLINLGNPDVEKREKSYICFLDDLKRCEALDLELYNLHPGSTVGQTSLETSLGFIAECINRAHKETQRVTVVLENMAGAGNIIGSDFAHLAGIIKLVDDQSRVGVCLDTCHTFAAGYDIRTKEGWNATMSRFDEQVGLKYLCGMHLNDSKTGLNSKKDRHENIGLGHLGLSSFQHILQDQRTRNIPLILETPSFEQAQTVWGTEIAVLQRVSARTVLCEGEGENADGLRSSDSDLVKEVAAAVKSGSEKKGGSGAVKANNRKAVKRGRVTKRKRAREEDEEEEEPEGDISTDDVE